MFQQFSQSSVQVKVELSAAFFHTPFRRVIILRKAEPRAVTIVQSERLEYHADADAANSHADFPNLSVTRKVSKSTKEVGVGNVCESAVQSGISS